MWLATPKRGRVAPTRTLKTRAGRSRGVVLAGWSRIAPLITVVYVALREEPVAMSMDNEARKRGDHKLADPLGQATSGRLVVRPDAVHLTVRGDPTMADLYQASFESPAPSVRVHGGTVTLRYPRIAYLTDLRALLRPRPTGQVTLNGSIPWHIWVRGGTTHTSFDLSGLTLYALALGGGASHVALNLPTPAGTVPVRVAGGVRDLTVLRPAGMAARVRIGRAARRLTLDEQYFGAIGGSTRWQSTGYDQTTDRYDIAVSGGADTMTILTR